VVDHEAEDGVPGLISVRGVKLTTARAEAEKVVDIVVRRLRRSAPPCRTATTPLAMARPLEGTIREQTVTAVHDEMAVHLSDVVLRRTDLGTDGLVREPDLEAAASAMSSARGWDEQRARGESAGIVTPAPPDEVTSPHQGGSAP
jgi:glycerol-3-phosphate dehydrogenase